MATTTETALPADEVQEHGPATLADLDAVAPPTKAEIIDGILYTQPRPVAPHSRAQSRINACLDGPFDEGVGGPGGWWILVEPGIALPGAPEVAPDVAGWRRARLRAIPHGRIDVVPDWIAEVLSPSNRRYDVRIKRPFYARVGVPYYWEVDPLARTLECFKLEGGRWMDIGTYAGADVVRAEPFAAVPIRLEKWWVGAETRSSGRSARAKAPARSRRPVKKTRSR